MRGITFIAKKQLRMLERNRLPDRVPRRMWEPYCKQQWSFCGGYPKRKSYKLLFGRMKAIWTTSSGREVLYIERKGIV